MAVDSKTVGPAIALAATWCGRVESRIAFTIIELMASRMSFSLHSWKTRRMNCWLAGITMSHWISRYNSRNKWYCVCFQQQKNITIIKQLCLLSFPEFLGYLFCPHILEGGRHTSLRFHWHISHVYCVWIPKKVRNWIVQLRCNLRNQI